MRHLFHKPVHKVPRKVESIIYETTRSNPRNLKKPTTYRTLRHVRDKNWADFRHAKILIMGVLRHEHSNSPG